MESQPLSTHSRGRFAATSRQLPTWAASVLESSGAHNQTIKKAATLGGGGAVATVPLLGDLVNAIAGFVFRRLDLDALLLGDGGDESSDAVCLPAGSLHDLGEGGSLGACNQL